MVQQSRDLDSMCGGNDAYQLFVSLKWATMPKISMCCKHALALCTHGIANVLAVVFLPATQKRFGLVDEEDETARTVFRPLEDVVDFCDSILP